MSYPVVNQDNDFVVSGSQFDIKKFILKLVSFLPWIIISVILSNSIARLYLRYTPKVHKVSAYVLIKEDEESSSDYKILKELGVMPGSREVQDQMNILQSFELSRGVVDSLDLQLRWVAEGRIASSQLYGKWLPITFNEVKGDTTELITGSHKIFVFDDRFLIQTGNEKAYYRYNDTFKFAGRLFYAVRNAKVNPDKEGYNLVVADRNAIAKDIRAKIQVQKLTDMGNIIEIATVDEIPERAIDVVNKLVELYNGAGLKDKNVVGYKTISFLKDRIDTVSSELDEIESKVEAYKRNSRVTDFSIAGNEYLNQSLAFDNLIVEQQGKLKLLEALESYILNSKSFTDIIPTNLSVEGTALDKLIADYNQAVLQFQNQSKISTEKDPTLIRLKNSIIELKVPLVKQLQSLKNGYLQKLQQLQNSHNEFDEKLASVPQKERELLKLKRQSSVKETLYLFLLQKKEETELSLASNINNTRVVDSAFDQGVVKPNGAQINSFALFAGILIPILVMIVLDFFDNKIQDRKQIEAGTKIPIIGELSFAKNMTKSVLHSKSRGILAEQFRLIRANLQYVGDADNSVKKILVTSFMSGEGKSFTSLNLAGSLSNGSTKVLLIELDLRKPKLSRYLNLKTNQGITEYIVNNSIKEEDVIFHIDEMDNVDIITSGSIPPNPTELLMSGRLSKLFNWADKKYDYIIIDSSPVGLVADGFLIDKHVDMCLFILRHKFSFKTTISYIDRLAKENKFKRIGIIVNGIKEKGNIGQGYTYGYSYGYGYGYSSYGYSEDLNGRPKWFRIFKKKV